MILIIALVALQLAAPAQQPQDVSVIVGEAAAQEAKSSLSKCTARSFQAYASSMVDGKMSQTNVVLCAKPGESDEQWLQTLQTTSDMITASSLSAADKAKLTTELQAAIARVRAEKVAKKSSGDD